MAKAQVFMTGEISPEAMLSMYRKLGVTLNGKVAVKLHSGEPGNKNFIRPAFMRPVIEAVNGTVVECNSAYGGPRSTSASHWQALKEHGWTENFKVDLLDEDGDVVLPVKNGLRLKENYVGSHLERYDSMLVLSHFKGHEMGGFGGALKNIAIGIASSRGKEIIHTSNDPGSEWKADLAFLESMADACQTILSRFEGKIAFVNAMMNISTECDCDGNASPPCMGDVGILSSLDPVALDQACHDLIYQSNDPGKKALIKRMEDIKAVHLLEAAEKLGLGTREYEIVT